MDLKDASLILSNYTDCDFGRSVRMRPYEVRVYHWN